MDKEGGKPFLRVVIRGLTEDDRGNPVVLLKSTEAEDVLPIWIGHTEALSIRLHLEGESLERPLTLDLLRTALESLGVKVVKVAVTELRDNTFYAEIHLQKNGDLYVIDARPSDSIALALRAEAPIFVAEDVFQKHKRTIQDAAGSESDTDEDLRRYLRDLDPGDF